MSICLRNFHCNNGGTQLEENIRIVGGMELIPYILDNHFFFGIGLNQMQSTFNIVNYSNSFLMI